MDNNTDTMLHGVRESSEKAEQGSTYTLSVITVNGVQTYRVGNSCESGFNTWLNATLYLSQKHAELLDSEPSVRQFILDTRQRLGLSLPLVPDSVVGAAGRNKDILAAFSKLPPFRSGPNFDDADVYLQRDDFLTFVRHVGQNQNLHIFPGPSTDYHLSHLIREVLRPYHLRFRILDFWDNTYSVLESNGKFHRSAAGSSGGYIARVCRSMFDENLADELDTYMNSPYHPPSKRDLRTLKEALLRDYYGYFVDDPYRTIHLCFRRFYIDRKIWDDTSFEVDASESISRLLPRKSISGITFVNWIMDTVSMDPREESDEEEGEDECDPLNGFPKSLSSLIFEVKSGRDTGQEVFSTRDERKIARFLESADEMEQFESLACSIRTERLLLALRKRISMTLSVRIENQELIETLLNQDSTVPFLRCRTLRLRSNQPLVNSLSLLSLRENTNLTHLDVSGLDVLVSDLLELRLNTLVVSNCPFVAQSFARIVGNGRTRRLVCRQTVETNLVAHNPAWFEEENLVLEELEMRMIQLEPGFLSAVANCCTRLLSLTHLPSVNAERFRDHAEIVEMGSLVSLSLLNPPPTAIVLPRISRFAARFTTCDLLRVFLESDDVCLPGLVFLRIGLGTSGLALGDSFAFDQAITDGLYGMPLLRELIVEFRPGSVVQFETDFLSQCSFLERVTVRHIASFSVGNNSRLTSSKEIVTYDVESERWWMENC